MQGFAVAQSPVFGYNTAMIESTSIMIPTSSAPTITSPIAKKRARFVITLIFAVGVVLFWLAHLAYQYYTLPGGVLQQSLIISFGVAGVFLITFSLLSSVLFRLRPKTAKHWRWRRRLGVSGVGLILGHVITVLWFTFNWNLNLVFWNWNPLENAMIFGALALVILLAMALTSTDWAVDTIGSKRWKFIHRFVYIAYLSAIFHFMQMGWDLLQNPVGYTLLVLVGLTILGHIYLFFVTIYKRKFPRLATLVGLLIIAGGVIVGFIVYLNIFRPLPSTGSNQKNPKTFADKTYKFKIGYQEPLTPIIGKDAIEISSYIPLCDPETTLVCLVYPDTELPRSNFGGAAVSVGLMNNLTTTEQCNTPYNGEQFSNFKVMTLNDRLFSIFVFNEGAMSHRSSSQRYRTWHDNKCFQLETRFNTTDPGVYEPGAITPISPQDQGKIYELLVQSMVSFEFTP